MPQVARFQFPRVMHKQSASWACQWWSQIKKVGGDEIFFIKYRNENLDDKCDAVVVDTL